MIYMFSCCDHLETLNIDNFNTSNLQKTERAFAGSYSLKNYKELINIIYNNNNHSYIKNFCICF